MANNPISVELSSSVNPQDLPKILISAPGYESKEITPYKGDGTAKTDLGIISLTPTNIALEQDKIKASQLTINQIKELSKGEKGADYYVQERLSNQINTLKSTLIPTVLTLIAGFGVTKASDLIAKSQDKVLDTINNKSSCPPQLELISIINKKNKLVKQLNNTLTVIDNTTKALGIAGGVIESLELALNLQLAITFPTPPAINEGIKVLDKKISQLKLVNSGILSILIILRQVLTQVIRLLNLLDNLVQKCYPEADQEQIAFELTALTIQQSTQLSPVVTEVNGFKIDVETESTTNPLKRRRAIAINKQNITMLKGDWSFSSIDQILIDELVFYIQQNNLKAD